MECGSAAHRSLAATGLDNNLGKQLGPTEASEHTIIDRPIASLVIRLVGKVLDVGKLAKRIVTITVAEPRSNYFSRRS